MEGYRAAQKRTTCARARQKVISGPSPRLAGRTWCSMFERRRTCSTSACVLDPVRRSLVRVPKPCCSVRLRPASTVIASTPVSGCDQVDRDGGRTRTLVTRSSRPRIHRSPRGGQQLRRPARRAGVSLTSLAGIRATLAGIPKFSAWSQRSH